MIIHTPKYKLDSPQIEGLFKDFKILCQGLAITDSYKILLLNIILFNGPSIA